MQLIADSGATKTRWAWTDRARGGMKTTLTRGLSPLFVSVEDMATVMRTVAATAGRPVSEVHFYGTGCGDVERCAHVAAALGRVFPRAAVRVASDLLAAARSLCGHAPGVAAILGTGMNTCRFDGEGIVDQVASLGFALGDEGSGAYLGRELLRAYFYRQLPPELARPVEGHLPGGRSELLTAVYQSDAPAAFLAKFTYQLAEHRAHPFVRELLLTAFGRLADRVLRSYPAKLPVHFTGSVARVFAPELTEALARRNRTVGRIVADPMPGLLGWHGT